MTIDWCFSTGTPLRGLPWPLGTLRRAHYGDQTSGWEWAGLSKASPEVWRPWWPCCGPHPCPWPSMDRSPLCGEVRVYVWAAHRPRSVCPAHIDLGFCLCPSWPGQLGCPAVSMGLSPLPSGPSRPRVPRPCTALLTLGGSESMVWKLKPLSLISPAPSLSSLSRPLLPLPLSLSLLLPNASWLCLNISPPCRTRKWLLP